MQTSIIHSIFGREDLVHPFFSSLHKTIVYIFSKKCIFDDQNAINIPPFFKRNPLF